MITEADISHLIRTLAKAKRWKETYAARQATGSGDTLVRWDGGVRLTLGRAAKIMSNIDTLWPSDLDWPENIPRPAKTKMSEGKTPLNNNKSRERTQA